MKKCLLVSYIVTALLFTGCKKESEAIDWNQELQSVGEMGESYKEFSSNKNLGKSQWIKSETGVLTFNGIIRMESYQEFLEKIDNDVHEIRLNSGGGSVDAALKIALEIKNRKLNVTVKGFCISSCANYLFLAGHEKFINGLVGFHGSAFALQKRQCEQEKIQQACQDRPNVVIERAFFNSVGISNSLFSITQSMDKGMRDGHNYIYYAPSAATLRALGINNVKGDQSSYYLSQMKRLYEKSGRLEFNVAADPNPAILESIRLSK